MKSFKDVKETFVVIASSLALGYFIYNILSSCGQIPFVDKKQKSNVKYRGNLVELLQGIDNRSTISTADLIEVLRSLSSQCAFTTVQDKIRDVGFLYKIPQLLRHHDQEVQTQTALLINNLSLNVQNQNILKECIPLLINVLDTCEDAVLSISVLKALTNLTTLNSSHENILPHIQTLCLTLDQSDVFQIKVQVLKIFVNLSTNEKICQHLLDAQLLRWVVKFVDPCVENDVLLRALTCCANIFKALSSVEQIESNQNVLQMINEAFKRTLLKITSHEDEEIRAQVNRTLQNLISIEFIAMKKEKRAVILDTAESHIPF